MEAKPFIDMTYLYLGMHLFRGLGGFMYKQKLMFG